MSPLIMCATLAPCQHMKVWEVDVRRLWHYASLLRSLWRIPQDARAELRVRSSVPGCPSSLSPAVSIGWFAGGAGRSEVGLRGKAP
jgi:hypothetical protein